MREAGLGFAPRRSDRRDGWIFYAVRGGRLGARVRGGARVESAGPGLRDTAREGAEALRPPASS